jgi:hypothetical protein
MKHIHHIIPKHMGGTDDPSNLIELTVEEHSQAHLKLYEQHGKKEDLCAYYMLSGKAQDPEFRKIYASIGGKALAKKRKELGIKWGFALMNPDELFDMRSKNGKLQGKRNAESGHIQKIQKLSDPVAAGRKGGSTTISRGKGSFADPEERLKSASKGGKIQGKRNAESGHLKRIAQLPNSRSKGKQWITNGIENKMITKGSTIPDGFIAGKIQKPTT